MAEYGLLKAGAFTGRVQGFDSLPPDISHKNLEWRLTRRDPNPVFNSATQKLSNVIVIVQPTEIVFSRTVVALTQAELDDIDKGKITSALLDLGFIVTKLVDTLLARGTIASTDFDTVTRQEYQDLKTVVTRLRP